MLGHSQARRTLGSKNNNSSSKTAAFWFFVAGVCAFAGSILVLTQSSCYPYATAGTTTTTTGLLIPTVTTTDKNVPPPFETTSSSIVVSPETCHNELGTNTVLDRPAIFNAMKQVIEANAFNVSKVRFEKIGQALLETAMAQNKYLITVQVGAMDGVSNDPLYEMFVGRRQPKKYKLSHWIPLAVEPVPANFESLQKTYQKLHTDKGLPCPFLLRGAVAYGNQSTSTCTFCRFNVDSTEEKCVNHPHWMKYQLGTLDCAHSRRFFNVNFQDCIIQDPVPCAPIAQIMHERNLPTMAMLQIDVEGYESTLIPNFLKDTRQEDLPPVIHFEHKVMHHLDKKNNTTRIADTFRALENLGYKLSDQGEDMLAILF